MFCFGENDTGKEDFDFNSLSPFVCSNLQCYGPKGTDPVLLFGGGENVTNGERMVYFKPDIMVAYQIPLKAEQCAQQQHLNNAESPTAPPQQPQSAPQ